MKHTRTLAAVLAGAVTGMILVAPLQAGVRISGPAPMQSGAITLSAGTGTATVASGATCVCTDTTANASVKCAVSGTTLTATGTASDVVAFLCR